MKKLLRIHCPNHYLLGNLSPDTFLNCSRHEINVRIPHILYCNIKELFIISNIALEEKFRDESNFLVVLY
jgi:hypothetical protein